MSPVVAPDFEWRAETADGDRHAFPQREDVGLPPPALCGVRWTVRFGEHGGRNCDSCMGTLRRILAGAQEALGLVDSPAGAGESVEAFRG